MSPGAEFRNITAGRRDLIGVKFRCPLLAPGGRWIMKIAAHVEKWQRFDGLRSRFDPIEEFELWYWSTMSGGTAIINAALHAAGVTAENQLFATQIPEVYMVMDGPDRWHREIGIRCDLIHVGLPVIDGELPPALQRAFSAMDELESYRDRCVREGLAVTADIASQCDKAYNDIVAAAKSAIAGQRQ